MPPMQTALCSPLPLAHEVKLARIAESKPIAQNQWSIWLKADAELPDFNPGNFCMLSLLESVDPLTPRPFAIVEKKNGMYHFIYRVTGKFTHQLATLPVGTSVGVMGPLGRGFSAEQFRTGKHAFIAGGVGYASLLSLFDQLKSEPTAVFYGVRTDLEIIRKGKFKALYSSDDGSVGTKGRITEVLKANQKTLDQTDAFYICGPTPMMKAVYDLIPPEKSFYFLEEAMGCGFGICIGCVVTVLKDGQSKRVRSCLEGPIFRGDELKPWREQGWQA